MAGSLSSIDVENLPSHKSSAIEVEHRVHDVRHISHPTHGMECRQCLMRFRQTHLAGQAGMFLGGHHRRAGATIDTIDLGATQQFNEQRGIPIQLPA